MRETTTMSGTYNWDDLDWSDFARDTAEDDYAELLDPDATDEQRTAAREKIRARLKRKRKKEKAQAAKCECGKDSVGDEGLHSDWCPKYI